MLRNFSQIFTQAAQHGLRLNNLSQLPTGAWHAQWRLDEGANEVWFSSAVDADAPLLALTRALDQTIATLETQSRFPSEDACGDLGLFD